MMKDGKHITMGIESSCNETAIAVLADGREILEKINRSRHAIGMVELDTAPPPPAPRKPKGRRRGQAKREG